MSTTMCEYGRTTDSAVHRNAYSASYDKQIIHQLIDEAPYCHISATVAGRPYIQATVHWRTGDKLYVHGAKKNKMIHAIVKGAEAAVAFTHFDGYLLTRSAFNHGVSYRSVVLFGKGKLITDLLESRRLLSAFVERVSPGRWAAIRQPSEEELKMVGVLEFAIEEVSAKIMMQGRQMLGLMPSGEYETEADKGFSPWTGIYPYRLVKGEPLSSDELVQRFR